MSIEAVQVLTEHHSVRCDDYLSVSIVGNELLENQLCAMSM